MAASTTLYSSKGAANALKDWEATTVMSTSGHVIAMTVYSAQTRTTVGNALSTPPSIASDGATVNHTGPA